jgi:hypothetical protein
MLFYLIFCIYNAYAEIQLLKFDIPGNYIIKPVDYNCSDNIIIELWGAGASGSCGYGKAGGSGAYVKASISTNNNTFLIKVGFGGNAPKCYGSDNVYGKNGTATSIMTIDNKINITVDGGKTISGLGTIEQSATVLSTIGANIYITHSGQTSRDTYVPQSCGGQFPYPCGSNGGSAYNGGLGGNGMSEMVFPHVCFSTNTDAGYYNQKNGQNPGAGGGSTACLSSDPQVISSGGFGANGTVIIYYTSNFQKNSFCNVFV